jgi:hypothetical protein
MQREGVDMSVDYFTCSVCNEARYEEAIISCEKCGASICDDCVVLDQNQNNACKYYFPDYIRNNLGELKPEHCPFCTGKAISLEKLFEYILAKYNIDEDEIKQEYLKSRNN